jgi:hypothetical protein
VIDDPAAREPTGEGAEAIRHDHEAL